MTRYGRQHRLTATHPLEQWCLSDGHSWEMAGHPGPVTDSATRGLYDCFSMDESVDCESCPGLPPPHACRRGSATLRRPPQTKVCGPRPDGKANRLRWSCGRPSGRRHAYLIWSRSSPSVESGSSLRAVRLSLSTWARSPHRGPAGRSRRLCRNGSGRWKESLSEKRSRVSLASPWSVPVPLPDGLTVSEGTEKSVVEARSDLWGWV